jgi:L-lactate dehydrogenase complex protein LldF
MKAFGVGASKPALYGVGAKVASKVVRPLLKDDVIHKGPGPMKPWTDVRDFPAPNKETFRDWFSDHEKEKKKK